MDIVNLALSREFEEEIYLNNINEDKFIIRMGDYKIVMSKELVNKLKSPYGIDKFILNEFEKQGFEFDKKRSQYIQYCFGNYVGAEVID